MTGPEIRSTRLFITHFRRRQACFRHRLKIAKAEAWRAKCMVNQSAYLSKKDGQVLTRTELTKILRDMAGFHFGAAGQRVESDYRGYRGDSKVGYRSCSKANWENAVRALEEDR